MNDYIYDDDEPMVYEDESPIGGDPEPIFDFDPEPLGWGENGSADNFMIKT